MRQAKTSTDQNMNSIQLSTIHNLEAKANEALSAKRVEGNDRSRIVSVSYSARGYYEATTASGSTDYLTVAQVREIAG